MRVSTSLEHRGRTGIPRLKPGATDLCRFAALTRKLAPPGQARWWRDGREVPRQKSTSRRGLTFGAGSSRLMVYQRCRPPLHRTILLYPILRINQMPAGHFRNPSVKGGDIVPVDPPQAERLRTTIRAHPIVHRSRRRSRVPKLGPLCTCD